MIHHLHRLVAAEQRVGAGGDVGDLAIGLVGPVVEAAALGQVVGLVGEARAPAARVAFLQADDVVGARQLGDLVQRLALATHRQHVRPAAHRVIAVAAGAGAGLDVGAPQLDLPALIGVGGLCLASHAPDRRLLVERGAHSAATSAPASASAPEAAVVSPAVRSRSTRWSTMRSTSWKSWSLTTRYLPLTTIVGVASTPLRSMNCEARRIWPLTAKLSMVWANFAASAPCEA